MTIAVLVAACLGLGLGAAPAGAATTSACGLAGYETTAPGACPVTAPAAGGDAEGGDFLGGLLGGAVSAMLSEVVSWVARGAGDALRMTASLIGATTSPPLTSAWFSATYARVGTLSALLTLPFLFAACVHALIRGDLAMVGRAAFGYLPLAALGVAIAAPLTALLLSATDEMCGFVSAAAGNDDAAFLVHAAAILVGLVSNGVSPFLVLSASVVVVGAAFALWLELLIRAAAVEVIVLMLPLFFAAMVWPARRTWAIRSIETLIALILSKFAIVAVLALGSSAVAGGTGNVAGLLTGAAIVVLAVLSPWALLRLLPLHEVAAAAASGLSHHPNRLAQERWSDLKGLVGGGVSDGDPADGQPGQHGGSGDILRRAVEFGSGHAALSAMDDRHFDAPTRAGIEATAHSGEARGPASPSGSAAPREDPPAPRSPTDFTAQRPFVIGAGDDADAVAPLDHGPAAEWFDFPRREEPAEAGEPSPDPGEPPPPLPPPPAPAPIEHDEGPLRPPPAA